MSIIDLSTELSILQRENVWLFGSTCFELYGQLLLSWQVYILADSFCSIPLLRQNSDSMSCEVSKDSLSKLYQTENSKTTGSTV